MRVIPKVTRNTCGNLNLVSLLIVFILALRASSQATEAPEANDDPKAVNTANENSTEIPFVYLNLCSVSDTVSSKYCSCKDKIVSCDFSTYPAPEKTIIAVHGPSMEPSTKRLCLCNTPRNVLLNLMNDLIPRPFNRSFGIHRVDLDNIRGPLHFTETFRLNFSGDLYMSNIAYLKDIQHWEFGRGFDLEIEDVEGLKCCSKINVSQSYKKPILHLENTTIGTIYSNGIDGVHLWKTVIMKAVKVAHAVESYGIKLGSQNVNVSFSLCQFNNVSDYGIEIEKFENLVVSKTMFNDSSPASFYAKSNLPNSSLVIVDNLFNNVMTWQLDAHRVICWYNMFDFWYRDTFEFLDKTTFSDRVFSIEYNTIGNYLINETTSIPVIKSGDSVIFNENVFGSCNCSHISGSVIPKIISINPSRCDFHKMNKDTKTGTCLIDFKSAMTSCEKDSTKGAKFSEMCNDPSISVSSFDAKLWNNGKMKASGINIDSQFINEMIKDTKSLFHIHQVSSHVESEEENEFSKSTFPSTNSNHIDENNSSTGGHTALYIFLTLLGFAILAFVAGIVFRKRRQASLLGGGQTPSDYDILTTSA